jgi:hypothetical protein
MNIASAFPSKYLRAADLGGRKTFVIESVAVEDLGDEEFKPVVHFEGGKAWVLNKTNATTLIEGFGSSESEDWIGKPVILFEAKTDFGGKRVPCIRCEVPANKNSAKTVVSKPVVPEPDDEFPQEGVDPDLESVRNDLRDAAKELSHITGKSVAAIISEHSTFQGQDGPVSMRDPARIKSVKWLSATAGKIRKAIDVSSVDDSEVPF